MFAETLLMIRANVFMLALIGGLVLSLSAMAQDGRRKREHRADTRLLAGDTDELGVGLDEPASEFESEPGGWSHPDVQPGSEGSERAPVSPYRSFRNDEAFPRRSEPRRYTQSDFYARWSFGYGLGGGHGWYGRAYRGRQVAGRDGRSPYRHDTYGQAIASRADDAYSFGGNVYPGGRYGYYHNPYRRQSNPYWRADAADSGR